MVFTEQVVVTQLVKSSTKFCSERKETERNKNIVAYLKL